MSRTRKTTPTPALGLVAHHDHTRGECDLPPMPRTKVGLRAQRDRWGIPLTSCTWGYPWMGLHREPDPWERHWTYTRKAKRLARWLAVDFDAQMEA